MGCFGSRVAIFRGCTFSRSSSRQSARSQTIFAVQNVDDTGQGVSPGKLEVTETDLVLHVKGKPCLTWPLRCLRRYGYDNDLFSFESGRRCPTGAGIFAFRCHRAQSLFNLLQAKIQGNPGSLPTVPSTPITPPNLGTPINLANNPQPSSTSTFVYVNLAESNSSRLLSTAGAGAVSTSSSALPITSAGGGSSGGGGDQPDVVQTQGSSIVGGGSRGPAVLTISSKPSSSISENHPVYVNVESHGGALFASSGASSSSYQSSSHFSSIPPPTAPRRSTPTSTLTSQSSSTSTVVSTRPLSSSSCLLSNTKSNPECALYSNVFCNHNKLKGTTSSGGVVCSHPLGTMRPSVVPVQQEPPEINYAELDLKTDRPSSSSSISNSPHLSSRLGLLAKHMVPPHSSATSSATSALGATDPLIAARLGGDANASAGTTNKTDLFHPRLTKSQMQNNGELGYATIDFDKTAALSCITRSKINLGFGDDSGSGSGSSKKSRHSTTGL